MTLYTLIGKEVSSFEKDGEHVVFCRLYFTYSSARENLKGIACEIVSGGKRLVEIAHALNVGDVCVLNRDAKGRVSDITGLDELYDVLSQCS